MKALAPNLACLVVLFALTLGCRATDQIGGASIVATVNDGNQSALVPTTYYGGSRERTGDMGPGHFACPTLQNVQQWYVAPSDTFGDPAIWDADTCPANSSGIPDCTTLMQAKNICGRKVKVKCGSNCRAGAPEIVLQITDACPKYHRGNAGGACQGGPAFDLSQSAWELLHDRDDNISVYYQRVDDSTPLGPVSANTSNGGGGGNIPTCTNGSNTGNGFGWQPELGGPNGGSCRVPTVQTQQNDASYPTCTNGSNTGNGFGWQPELGGPNGGSCRVPTVQTQQNDAPFPTCTNGSNTGNGFGWQPELHGPNGGSCRVPTVQTQQNDGPYPTCTNGSNTGNGFGWQPELHGPNGGSCRVPVATTTTSSSGGSSASSSDGRLLVELMNQSAWQDGYCITIKISNKGASPINSWAISIKTNGASISQTWNLTSSGGDTPTFKPIAAWNAVIQPGDTNFQQGFCTSTPKSDVKATIDSIKVD